LSYRSTFNDEPGEADLPTRDPKTMAQRVAELEAILVHYDQQWGCPPEQIWAINRAASHEFEAYRKKWKKP